MSTHVIRAAWLFALFFANCIALAADLQAVAVDQAKPGVVVVTVRSPDDHPAANAFHLHLTSNGVDTNVAAADVSPGALSPDLATLVIICVDRSGSMHDAVEGIKRALEEVLATPRPDLRIGIMSFATDITPLSPYTANAPEVLRVVDTLRMERGRYGKTKLFDAIAAAIDLLQKDPARGPKRLIVISDGKDEGSSMPQAKLVTIVQDHAPLLDAIGFGPLAPEWSGTLASLANMTGGKFVLAGNAAALSDTLKDQLGTSEPAALKVKFNYDAASGGAPASAAVLEYAAPGLPVKLIPINAVITAAAPLLASGPDAASTPKPSGINMSITLFDITFDGKSLLAALLALLAGGSAAAVYIVRHHHPPEPAIPPNPGPVVPPLREHPGTRVSAFFPPPGPAHPAAYLVSGGGRKRITRFPIEKVTVQVGADENNDLIVPNDDWVSRKHARIRYETGTLYLSDLGSRNGTFRNDTRLSSASVALSPGDVIRFGRTTYEVRGIDDAQVAAQSGQGEGKVL